jgi:hypothetical protein
MSFESLVKKLVKEGKSETAAKKIAGSVANAKMKGAGSGPTAAQKARSKGPKMKSDSKEMKPHNMYGSGGVVKFVKTMKEHLALKAKGYGHTKKK